MELYNKLSNENKIKINTAINKAMKDECIYATAPRGLSSEMKEILESKGWESYKDIDSHFSGDGHRHILLSKGVGKIKILGGVRSTSIARVK